jgi:hypothetical protein
MSTFLPDTLRFLARKPCLRLRLRCEGWYSAPRDPYRTCCTRERIGELLYVKNVFAVAKGSVMGERKTGMFELRANAVEVDRDAVVNKGAACSINEEAKAAGPRLSAAAS